MNATEATARPGLEDRSVKPFELFFDLVFVFAFTQVTQVVANDLTWAGLGRGLLLIAALWWSWVAFSWLATTTDLEEGRTRGGMVAVMGAMLVAAMAVPGAFADSAAQFAGAYLFVRVMHLILYLEAAWQHGDRELGRQIVRLAPFATGGPAIILVAAVVQPESIALWWLAALAVDYLGALAGGGEGWVVHAAHFAERHGLILIVALGEAIISIGVGARALELGPEVIGAALLGYAAIVSMWWLYFDVVALAAERRLAAARGGQQARLARDGYSYFHLPMIAGLIMFSLGVKKVMAHPDDVLVDIGSAVLFGGLAAYLIGSFLLRLRFIGTVSPTRTVALAALVALAAWSPAIQGLHAIAIASSIFIALVVWERVRYAELRRNIRSGTLPFFDPKGRSTSDDSTQT